MRISHWTLISSCTWCSSTWRKVCPLRSAPCAWKGSQGFNTLVPSWFMTNLLTYRDDKDVLLLVHSLLVKHFQKFCSFTKLFSFYPSNVYTPNNHNCSAGCNGHTLCQCSKCTLVKIPYSRKFYAGVKVRVNTGTATTMVKLNHT